MTNPYLSPQSPNTTSNKFDWREAVSAACGTVMILLLVSSLVLLISAIWFRVNGYEGDFCEAVFDTSQILYIAGMFWYVCFMVLLHILYRKSSEGSGT